MAKPRGFTRSASRPMLVKLRSEGLLHRAWSNNRSPSASKTQPASRLWPAGRGLAPLLNPRTDHLNIQIPDLLAQRVAVDAEQVGGADLIAARCRECCGQQRVLHFAQDAVI